MNSSPNAETIRRAIERRAQQREAWTPAGPSSPGPDRVVAPSQPVVLDLWREDLVARIAAGATLAQVDAALAPLSFRLHTWAPHPESTSLGAVFARAERGFRSDLGGTLRERALGLRAIDGLGHVHTAGARVVKNVAGYDITRLHHGAGGAFGLVLDFVVRLDARPESSSAWFLATDDPGPDLARLRRPSASMEPVVQVWVSPRTAASLGLGDRAGVVVMVEGWEAAVEEWRQSVPTELMPARMDALTDHAHRAFQWSTPTVDPRLWEALDRVGSVVVDLAAQVVHLVPDDPDAASLRAAVTRAAPRGFVSPRRPAAAVPRQPAPLVEIQRRLKSSLDPYGLLPSPPTPLAFGRP